MNATDATSAAMSASLSFLPRRQFVVGFVAAAATAGACKRVSAQVGGTVSLADFGARPGGDATAALQRALDSLAARGGGTLRIGSTYRAGIAVVRGSDITIEGDGGTLRDTRIVVAPGARRLMVRNLTLLETRGRPDTYLLDVSGTDCRFDNLSLIKQPMAGGYQGYLRASSRGCTFDGLRLDGSNGLFVSGSDHSFTNFELVSTLRRDMGGDDAFAIKAPGTVTQNIVIRNGTVRGYAAAVSIGSEVGSNAEHRDAGIVRNVLVENVVADRCQMVCFIKPGALIYDWRNGLVENVTLRSIQLTDAGGFLFARGVAISAGRGATVRGVTARDIVIEARAHSQGVMPTAAVDLGIRNTGTPASIENVDIQLAYDGSGSAGYPVDQIVRIEKEHPSVGTMRGISLDVSGSDARIAGIYVGGGLDGAVTVRRASLRRVALDPPASLGAAGIWADSRVTLGSVTVEAVRAPSRGGRAR